MAPREEVSLHNQENILARKEMILVAASLASAIVVCNMDRNGISTILPTIARDIHAKQTISWAGTSSLIASTAFSVLYGRMSDIFGRNAVFYTSCVLMGIAELACGFSNSGPLLYVFRGITGVANGGIQNLVLIIVSDVVTLEQRGLYQGIFGAFVAAGNVIGPFVAAGFAEGATWRGFFWFLAPLIGVCIIPGIFCLPPTKPTDEFMENLRKIDFLGAATSTVAVVFLLIPIASGGTYFAWASPLVISMLTIGSVALLLFLLVEWKVAHLPMIPLGIFKTLSVCVLMTQTFCVSWVAQSNLYYLPFYFQNVRGYSSIKSAAFLMPIIFTQVILSVLSGLYISKTKRYGEVIWIGFGLYTIGTSLMLLFNHTFSPAWSIVILCINGIGQGCCLQPTLVTLQAHTPKEDRATVISSRNFFRGLGASCGLAVSASVLQSSLKKALPATFASIANSPYSIPHDFDQETMAAIVPAFAHASRSVFIANIPVISLCLLGCVFVRDRGLVGPEPSEKGQPGGGGAGDGQSGNSDLEEMMVVK